MILNHTVVLAVRDPLVDGSSQQESANIASDSTNRGNYLVSYYDV